MRTQKPLTMKQKIDKQDLTKMKNFCSSENIIKNKIRKTQSGKTYLQYIKSRKAFYLEYIKNAYKSIRKKQSTQVFLNGQKTPIGTPQKRIYKCNIRTQR